MKALILSGLAVASIACYSSPRTSVGPGSRSLGTFAYSADLGSRKEIGTFSIEADTVTVDSDQGLCRRLVKHEVDERIHNFDCVGIEGTKSMVLVIDSRSPMSSTWYGTRGVTKWRNVCVQYATKSTGETYCASSASEAYETAVGISGPLHVASAKAN